MSDAKLFGALAKAFPKIEGALKDTENPAFKRDGKAHKYADLASVVAAVKPALADNALFFTQLTHEHDGGVCVETIVGHESGEQMSFGKLFVPSSKNDAQAYGSALTYARRYSLMAAFGVCPEDDDGNAAAAAPVSQRKPDPKPEAPAVLTDEQFQEMVKLAGESNTPPAEIAKQFGVEKPAYIPQSKYVELIDWLDARRKPKSLAAELNDEIPKF